MAREGGKTTRRTTTKAPASKRAGQAPDDGIIREVEGIAIVALAVALAIAVLTESAGVLPRAIAMLARQGFGIGAYFMPVVLLAWGLSFFISRLRVAEGRVGAGLALSFLAVIAMVALSAPVQLQWQTDTVAAHGGYVGAGVAWLLRSLLGEAIAYVIGVALLLIGLVFTGMSISSAVTWAASRRRPGVTDAEERRGAKTVRRAAKTMPLADVDVEPRFTEGLEEVREKPRRKSDDPEARRKTMPTPTAVAPRAMEGFELPSPSLLARSPQAAAEHRTTERELKATAGVIESTLGTFDIPVRVVGWVPGPTVTLFEMQIAKGVKVNRVTALADDIAMALAASTVRILAPIPGKSLIGVEVPNERRSTVTLGDVMAGARLGDREPLLLAIGKDVSGESIVADLAAMPHMLIAGATGTGKSVCINALLMSLLMRATPAEVRMILIDPKRIELSLYADLPHLLVPVVTEAKEAASALAWAVQEMESRLKRLQKAGARNIGGYNTLVAEGKAPEGAEEMPYIVVVIDELADLMMVAAKEVEDSICRLAQLARAAGIHLVVATQRPSTDIITGLIKTNITHRIAFAVSSGIDSRVIIDQTGAEKLVGRGDMLFSTPAWPKPKRVQGAYVSEAEISSVVEHVRGQAEPDYHPEILQVKVSSAGSASDFGDEDDDPLLWEAADIVVTSGMGSTSLLQRRLKVGYARAGRIMDILEAKGIVGPPDGSKPRDVMLDVEGLESLKAFERLDAAE